MRAAIVESIHELRAMRRRWDDLISRAPNGDLFGTFDWIECWWTHFAAREHTPLVAVAIEHDMLVAGVCLLRDETQPFRALRSMFNHYSGRTDLYVDPRYPDATATLLVALSAEAPTWDVLELDWIPEDSPFYLHLAHAELDGLAVHALRVAESPYVELGTSTFERYYRKQFSAKTRSRDRGSVKELEARSGYVLETITDRARLREALELAMGIETLGWKGESNSSMKQDPRVHAFVHEICERLAVRGEVMLTMLHAGGEAIAFVLGFVRGEDYYYYKTSFDPKFAELRPGRVVTNFALEGAFGRGLRRFDFLGAADDYKLRYADNIRAHATIFLHHGGWRSRVHRGIKRSAIPLTKQILKRPGVWPIVIDRPGRPWR